MVAVKCDSEMHIKRRTRPARLNKVCVPTDRMHAENRECASLALYHMMINNYRLVHIPAKPVARIVSASTEQCSCTTSHTQTYAIAPTNLQPTYPSLPMHAAIITELHYRRGTMMKATPTNQN